jgi:hypothetical protein
LTLMIIESYGYLISMISAVHAVKKTFTRRLLLRPVRIKESFL